MKAKEICIVVGVCILIGLMGQYRWSSIQAQTGIELKRNVNITSIDVDFLPAINRPEYGSGVALTRIGSLLVKTASIGTAGAYISTADSTIAYQAFPNTAWFIQAEDSVQIDGYWGYQIDSASFVWHLYGTLTIGAAKDTIWYWSSLNKCEHVKIKATTTADSSGDSTWVFGKLLRDRY